MPVALRAGESKVWGKAVGRTNAIFLWLSLIFSLGVSLPFVTIGFPGLGEADEFFEVWLFQLPALALLVLFWLLEKRKFIPRFSTTTAGKLDGWIYAMVLLRNLILFLNTIPYIQLLGMAGAVFGGPVILVVYAVLVRVRYKGIWPESAQPAQPEPETVQPMQGPYGQ